MYTAREDLARIRRDLDAYKRGERDKWVFDSEDEDVDAADDAEGGDAFEAVVADWLEV